MYGRAYWIFLSRGRSTPAMRAIPYPCRCLCLGLRLQMTRITPRRLITLQCSQIGLTLVRTFNAVGSGRNLALGKNPIKSRTIDGVVSSRKGSNYGVPRSSTDQYHAREPPPHKLSRSRWYTPAGSFASGIGLPTTRWVAPQRTASRGATVRAWSPDSSPGARTPGTTIQGSGPSAARSSASSRPEATTPRSPACNATRARRSASRPRSGTPRPTICANPSTSCDVRTVTPTSAKSPAAAAAAAAAASIADPPRQWTVASAAPSSRAAVTAPATTPGISCHLRSTKTRTPRAWNSRTSAGPSRTYSIEPSFAHLRAGRRAARASASRPVGASNATMSTATRQLARDPRRDARVGERRRADRDERGACGEILARVRGTADAAHADHRHPDLLGDLERGQDPDRQ